MSYDPIQNPAGELRRAAGGSSNGTSTGGVLVSQTDPLAGLNAVTPGLDLGDDGELRRFKATANDPSPEDVLQPGDAGGVLALLALLAAAVVALKVVFG